MPNIREKQINDTRFHEETGAELAPRLNPPSENRGEDSREAFPNESLREVQEGAAEGTTLGITGIVLSVMSLFFLPFLLAFMGLGAGYVAYRRGATSLGKWAIGISVISLIGTILLAPMLVS